MSHWAFWALAGTVMLASIIAGFFGVPSWAVRLGKIVGAIVFLPFVLHSWLQSKINRYD